MKKEVKSSYKKNYRFSKKGQLNPISVSNESQYHEKNYFFIL